MKIENVTESELSAMVENVSLKHGISKTDITESIKILKNVEFNNLSAIQAVIESAIELSRIEISPENTG